MTDDPSRIPPARGAASLTLEFDGACDLKSPSFTYLKTAIGKAVDIYTRETGCKDLRFTVSRSCNPGSGNETEGRRRTGRYSAVPPDPRYTFDRLVMPKETKEKILSSLTVFTCQTTIFDDWGLKEVANPMVALSLEGKPGTGKTMAAHAIANYLKRPVLHASYAEIESMYHGEGPKNVQAVFNAASEQNAVLFIDDAESLLSKRLDRVTSGSENAINSMRDQFLICLEQYRGLVVFASNKAESYDPALETRMWTIHFDLPDRNQRREIWRRHLPSTFPTAATPEELSEIDGICGREIRNAVLEVACLLLARAEGRPEAVRPATFDDFKSVLSDIKSRRCADGRRQTCRLSDKTAEFVGRMVKGKQE